jgi:hypothetical protein
MPNTVSNYGYTTAISPTIWSTMVQQPLYKRLVALKVCNTRLVNDLGTGKAIQIPKFRDLTAATYTPGTDLSAQSQIWEFDTINVSTFEAVVFYVDDVRKLQTNIAVAVELAGQAGYQLADKIDQFAFNKITGGVSVGLSAVDRDDVFGDSSTGQITAASTNIIDLFAGMTKHLRENNVEEAGDWAAVVSPRIASFIEIKAASTGFSLADSTLKNGYAGDWMGYEIYVSNNLPTGVISAMVVSGFGGPSAAGSATTGTCHFFGRKNSIDVILQRAPAMEIRPNSNKIGSNFITWDAYGAGITGKNRGRARATAIIGA